MAGNFYIWLTLVYLINFSSSEIQLEFSSNACNRTCANLDFGDACNDEGLEPGLQCPGFLNSKNECVYQCDAADVRCKKANHTFSSCGSPCHTTCATLYTNFMRPCMAMCFVGCGCSGGYVLNAEKECVLPENCNPSEIECPKDTTFSECGKGVLRTCYNYHEEIKDHAICIPTCSCPDNLVFDSETGACVDSKFCYDSEENTDCMAKHGQGSRYMCYGDNCGCVCSDWYKLDLDTDVCEFDWGFGFDD